MSWATPGEAAHRLLAALERSVRGDRAGEGAAPGRRPAHARDHRAAPVSHLRYRSRDGDRDAVAAVRPGRRGVDHVAARLRRDAGGVAIEEGAVNRVRPKLMTVLAIMLGLVPALWSHGAGASVMKRIAAPMVGGMVTSTVLTLVVIPVIYYLWRRRGHPETAA